MTGQHTVSDISCSVCGSVLGWKYVEAQEESQRYKVGKFILETRRIRGAVDWENGDSSEHGEMDAAKEGLQLPPEAMERVRVGNEAVEFDSQDEDECEDLFAGVWSPELALKRRRAKRFGRGSGNAGGRGVRM